MPEPSSVKRITCNNPSPMTLQGTNTYVLGAGEGAPVVIVDPGPAGHPEHLAQVRAVVGPRPVTQILVTHRHADHTGAAASFSEAFAAPVRGHSPEQCLGTGTEEAAPLTPGEEIALEGLRLSVLHTPGHTSDSLCFWIQSGSLPQGQAMLTGDTLLGEGTTMLDHPDGTLTDYLRSLETLRGFGGARMLPAHGPEQPSVAEVAERYLTHRLQRLDQVRALLRETDSDAGRISAAELGGLIYGQRSGLPAGITTKIAAAQLGHLEHLGELDPPRSS
ncbi:MBL fold metallo-hydrolase [Nesterenkonia lutea]|uniref:Glyoxylase-like metal-dependent hydrolase (Beta-lactamase superfamily II) n=1 Tax=Nesterenkonia lutea TaxID=272919 RepID=A0ABR9JFZ0_9MICC|nr:MBL fold metallo-hydrolase [Nesterenkonia lutea]MBE1524839.1 glyoxylase-like metal-dependent hydrolase (beta-lactamase superfamily II) [Nesterenkonia lutea]